MDSSRDIVRKLRENRILNERKDYENMSKDELIKLAKEEDQLAMSTLLKQYEDFLFRMTYKYVPEGTFEKEDIRQIAEIAFWEAIKKWDGSGDFDAYAGMVIKRRIADELRKLDTDSRYANRVAQSLDAADEDGEDDESSGMNKGDRASIVSQSFRSAEDEYIDQDFMDSLDKFIEEELTDVERQVIRLYIENYKTKEIAEVLDMKYKRVENAIARAKWKLMEYIRGIRESKRLKVNESIFTDEEKDMILKSLDRVEGKSREMNESTEDSVYMRDIIDTWNMIEKYNIPYTQENKGIKISREDYNKLLSSVKNPKYIRNLANNK